jgi:hypothetical protein
MTWRMNREAILFLAAGRALPLQLAHPWIAAPRRPLWGPRERPIWIYAAFVGARRCRRGRDGVAVWSGSGLFAASTDGRSRPSPNCFAIADRRSEYSGAVSGCSGRKLQRARYWSGLSSCRAIKWRRSVCPRQPQSKQTTTSRRTDRRIGTAGLRASTGSGALPTLPSA